MTDSMIELIAGQRPDGGAVIERVPVSPLGEDNFRLEQSPAFVKGVARGDEIRLVGGPGQFAIVRRSGNLNLRLLSRGDLSEWAPAVTAELEKLGGSLDVETPRMCVYSVHVSCGFQALEKILNEAVAAHSDSAWFYGNVYDPKDGSTPLNWWQDMLKPE